MNVSGRNLEQQEPMGIVISRGSRTESAPKFLAFVWAPAPQDVDDASRAGELGTKAA